jgi:hypothetical protein
MKISADAGTGIALAIDVKPLGVILYAFQNDVAFIIDGAFKGNIQA